MEINPGIEESGDFPCDSIPVLPIGDYRFTLPSSRMNPEIRTDPARAYTWEDFIVTLPVWERDLLKEFTERYDSSEPLYLKLQQQGTIFVVSDGGAAGNYGSFGLVIGTDDEVLCEGLGTARGGLMQSF